ncbi:MAG: hypothetical protein ABFS16_12380 [Bacteroidota bacterium]
MSERFLGLFILLIISSQICYSQIVNSTDKLSAPQIDGQYAVSEERAKEIYNDKLHHTYDFLNGKEYKLYHVNLETSPLFDASLGMEGTVYIDGEKYTDLMLIYDIYKDELVSVTGHFTGHNFISFNQSRIDSFALVRKNTASINDYRFKSREVHFKKVDFPENINIEMQDGYYEVIEHGGKQIFIHHEAILSHNEGEEAIISGIFRYDYKQKRTLYMNGNYYDINSKRKFVKLFPEHRKAINKKLQSFSTRFDLINKERLLETLKLIEQN